jgi:hypothetical protein
VDPPAAGHCDAQCHASRSAATATSTQATCDDGARTRDACSNSRTPVTGCGDGACAAARRATTATRRPRRLLSHVHHRVGLRCGVGSGRRVRQVRSSGPGMPECNYLCHLGPPRTGTERSLAARPTRRRARHGVPIAGLTGPSAWSAARVLPHRVGDRQPGPLHSLLSGAYGTSASISSCRAVDCDGAAGRRSTRAGQRGPRPAEQSGQATTVRRRWRTAPCCPPAESFIQLARGRSTADGHFPRPTKPLYCHRPGSRGFCLSNGPAHRGGGSASPVSPFLSRVVGGRFLALVTDSS